MIIQFKFFHLQENIMTSTDGVVNISSDDSSDLKPSENLLCTYPPGANRGGVSIKSSDLFCLEDKEWLTDQIISKGVNYFCIIINYVKVNFM